MSIFTIHLPQSSLCSEHLKLLFDSVFFRSTTCSASSNPINSHFIMAGYLSVPALEALVNKFLEDRTDDITYIAMISGLLNYYFSLDNDFTIFFHPRSNDVPAYFVIQRLLRWFSDPTITPLIDHLVVVASPLTTQKNSKPAQKGFFANALEEFDIRFRPLETVLQHGPAERYSYWVMFFDADLITFHKYECEGKTVDWLAPLSIWAPDDKPALPTEFSLQKYAGVIDWMLRYMRRDVEVAVDGTVEGL